MAAVFGLSACSGASDTAAPATGPSTSAGPSASPSAGPLASTADEATTSTPVASSAEADAGPSGSSAGPTAPADTTSTSAAASSAPAADAPLVLPESLPVSLSVPAIGITSPLSSLGRNPDGTVEVPSLDDPNAGAGWFRDSPEPGSIGPAIILGHVDSREFGPGVFYDLKNLSAGDTIDVTRADGTVAVFTVDSVQDVPKAQFPTEQIYGNLDHAGLRLITCGGVFDSEARSYEDNIIAFASLTSTRAA